MINMKTSAQDGWPAGLYGFMHGVDSKTGLGLIYMKQCASYLYVLHRELPINQSIESEALSQLSTFFFSKLWQKPTSCHAVMFTECGIMHLHGCRGAFHIRTYLTCSFQLSG